MLPVGGLARWPEGDCPDVRGGGKFDDHRELGDRLERKRRVPATAASSKPTGALALAVPRRIRKRACPLTASGVICVLSTGPAWSSRSHIAWCNRSQPPAVCQSRGRRWQATPLGHPSSGGSSCQGGPVLRTKRRLSSTTGWATAALTGATRPLRQQGAVASGGRAGPKGPGSDGDLQYLPGARPTCPR